jgi:putative transposase
MDLNRTRVFRLSACSREQRIREAQREAARVYAHCAALHTAARHAHARWPGRRELQAATRGQFALHSQTVQAIRDEFLANIETTRALRRKGCRAARYPQWQAEARPQTVAAYRPLTWPAQAVALQHGRLILPMGRGRKSLVFARPDGFPEELYSSVNHGAYKYVIGS